MLQSQHLVNVIQDRNATVAEWFGEGVIATGSAKREPGEPFDERVGVDLAVSRALMNAARQLEERALGKLAEIEAERVKKEAATYHSGSILTSDELAERIKDITDQWKRATTLDSESPNPILWTSRTTAFIEDEPRPTPRRRGWLFRRHVEL